MIKIYTREGCTSSLKTKDWLESHGIEFEQREILQLSQQDMTHLLSLTDLGFEELLKLKGKQSKENLQTLFHFNEWSLTECVQFLKYHTEFLKTPIILDQEKYMMGYNSEEIRKFLPKSYRKMEIRIQRK
ncbi:MULTISPECIES: ArsC/Spx/MgsR family protein [Lactococcus]|uniref:Regulatory protein spx n=1 Tax=Lactococcus garvieae TaxID=1363 RepID=A0A1I4IC15_9LACT|nr:ArsC/Spx/MgsR family protein [Lactococcus garvieae]SFL51938.1 regulatory protein spx [Lactococcus garvieae]